ncbi:aromatic ring-hydroxylating oxygenase subunit alpha [Streptomyces albidoflavus]|uniref:aromatic ring-hydroxylating oxygenase subunit alpha n=1 Tax=Streptomyces albidoflavus TaxID=1886 RepID=UPI00101E3580|nr:aromatic ring-hydroxylating dioxygenase subunit alpha [Streptomyces albidoflavus]RZD76779.1 2Fe-2S ferredoxin [Streptomyces albidoflavus]
MTTMTNASSLIQALPREYYTDPGIYEADKRRVFESSWVCTGRADAIEKPGQFLRVTLGDESVLLVRGRDRKIRALRNLCRHRGAQLCTEETGSFDKAIRCMYHAWTYGLDGRLIAAPNMSDMPDLVKDDYGLHPVHAEEWLGYVWVNLADKAEPLHSQLAPQIMERLGNLDTLDRYGIEKLGVVKTIVYDVESNWKAIIENFLECYHCATVHPELSAALPQIATGYGGFTGGVGGGVSLAEDIEGFSLSGKATSKRLPGLLPEDDRIFYGMVLRPNVILWLVPDHVAVVRLEPQAPGQTRVTVDWLYDREAMAAEGFDPTDAIELLDLTNRQDFEACERCQMGMKSSAYQAVFVPAEHPLRAFQDWYLEELGHSAEAVPPASAFVS